SQGEVIDRVSPIGRTDVGCAATPSFFGNEGDEPPRHRFAVVIHRPLHAPLLPTPAPRGRQKEKQREEDHRCPSLRPAPCPHDWSSVDVPRNQDVFADREPEPRGLPRGSASRASLTSRRRGGPRRKGSGQPTRCWG